MAPVVDIVDDLRDRVSHDQVALHVLPGGGDVGWAGVVHNKGTEGPLDLHKDAGLDAEAFRSQTVAGRRPM